MKPKESQQQSSIPLSSSQLLEISQEISSTFNPQISSNICELVILPVDPFHLHAYWHLDKQQLNDIKSDTTQQLALKVYWKNDKNSQQDQSKLCFNVNLDSNQSQQKIRLPVDASNYSATLGTLDENKSWNILVDSNTIHIPAASIQPKMQRRQAIKHHDEQPITILKNKQPSVLKPDKIFDEQLIDVKIKQIVLQQSIEISAEQLVTTAAIVEDLKQFVSSEIKYDENQIDAFIQQTLHETRLNSSATKKTITSNAYSLKSHFAASNFSGQNFLF